MLRPLLPLRLPYIPAVMRPTWQEWWLLLVRESMDSSLEISRSHAGHIGKHTSLTHGGGLAGYAVSSAKLRVKRPPGVSTADGAELPTAVRSTLKSLRSIGAKFDGTTTSSTLQKNVLNLLITAASSGVGHYAVQLAKLAGFHVTATCGAQNMELVRNLGADEVLDYKTPEGASLRSPSGKKYDAVVHCTGSAFKAVLASKAGKAVLEIHRQIFPYLNASTQT
ncbi:hypothetical protein EJB05_37267, partial [Eragrostis curvula]